MQRLPGTVAALLVVVLQFAASVALPQQQGGGAMSASLPVIAPRTLSVGDWLEIVPTGAIPTARREHGAVYDEVNDRMVIYGGAGAQGILGDTWVLDMAGTPTWREVATAITPGVRRGAATVHDTRRNRMIVFGGDNGSRFLNDVWALSLDGEPAWVQLNPVLTPPASRMHSAAVYDSVHDRIVLFGGYSNMADTWELSLSSEPPRWRFIYTPPWPPDDPQIGPSGRWGHMGIHDSERNRMIVYGGAPNSPTDTRALKLEPATPYWERVVTQGAIPPPMHGAASVYERTTDAITAFGGVQADLSRWRLSLAGEPAWSQLPAVGVNPVPRRHNAMVLRSEPPQAVVFGGFSDSGGFLNDTWLLQLGEPSVVPSINSFAPASAPPGSSITITGRGFQEATEVRFGRRAAAFSIVSDSVIVAVVPTPGPSASGAITVIATGGIAVSMGQFLLVAPPVISDFSPQCARPGDTVTLWGVNLLSTEDVLFGGVPATITTRSDTVLQATIPADALSGNIDLGTLFGRVSSTGVLHLPPRLADFSLRSGPFGTEVLLHLRNLAFVESVALGGIDAGFVLVGDTAIAVTIPSGAPTGPITVRAPCFTVVTDSNFVVAETPVVRSFTPESAKAGMLVRITGDYLLTTQEVAFHGVPSVFAVQNDTTVDATVPPGAATGSLHITTAFGATTSARDFVVLPNAAIVPDDFATIQAALDSPADTVFVRYGHYAESLLVSRPVTLIGLPDSTMADTLPRISSVSIDLWSAWPCYGQPGSIPPLCSVFRNVAFDGRVSVSSAAGYHGSCFTPDSASFDGCRFNGEVVHRVRSVKLALRRCVFHGPVSADSRVLCEGSTFLGGSISAGANDGGFADINDNVFYDVPGTAIQLSWELGASICRNRILGAQNGIVETYQYYFRHDIRDNTISDCSGDGIRAMHASVVGNTVRNCGGAGIVITSAEDSCVGNRVQDVGGDGISISRFNSSGQTSRRDVIDNVVVRAGGTGIVSGNGNIVRNVVGHCGGDGIRSGDTEDILNNTCYANGGSGIAVLHADSVGRNIVAWNRGWGIVNTNSRGDRYPMSCNDWFMNDSGPVQGLDIGATDLEVDPLFCNVESDSVWLRFDSPLVDAPGCGRIGALGVGCDVATSTRDPRGPTVPAESFDLALSPPVPNPGSGNSRIRYSLPEAMYVRLSVFDVLGREVATLARGMMEAGEHDAPLSVAGLRAGVYLARLEAGGKRLTQRVLIVP